jgi:hypothetical protein
MSDSSHEREVLKMMRKVLASIIKDTTPEHRTMKHPLSDATIEQVRDCLGFISTRERQLADEAGVSMERPYFTDEEPSAKVIPIDNLSKKKH